MPFSKFLQWQTHTGQPLTIGDMIVTPQAQALVARFPRGGFVWNRPVALLIARDGQPLQRIPIVDVTRLAQIGLLLSAVMFVMLGFARRFKM